MREDIEQRAKILAKMILENNSTIRATAKDYGISKSTVHKDLACRLQKIDPVLYEKVREILEENFAEKHIRGGQATKQKYLEKE